MPKRRPTPPERIRIAGTTREIRRCFPVMAELRPHLAASRFVARVRRQQQQGYRLVFLEAVGDVQCVAGFRINNCLAWGKFLYVDDLVTAAGARSKGYGRTLLDWLIAAARRQDCAELHLDSGVQRFGAHRFYLAQRMDITCHHFAITLKP